ncbi:MAG: hypothetical protein ACOYN0_10540 [Phycisphaerales bacterium]
MSRDIFPETERTFIFSCLGTDARSDELKRHLFAVYSAPLRAYFLGTSYRNVGEPDDIVHGYLLNRLSRIDFIPKWRASGMRLRRWLMTGLVYYLQEYVRKEGKRAACRGEMLDDHAAEEIDHAVEMDREFARSVVRRAIGLARASCERDELSQHHEFFCTYYLRGRTCEEIGADSGVGADRVWVMVRTVQRRFIRALRDVLRDDGVDSDSLDEEIANLLRASGGAPK